MERFLLPAAALAAPQVHIGGDTARQITRVLRMEPGDEICLLDGTGWEYRARLLSTGRDEVTAEVLERTLGTAEPSATVTLYLALLNKADKFEWALQKCTELGAAAFVPVRASRSVADIPGGSKTARWDRIIQEAVEQSGRSLLPELHPAVSFEQAIEREAHLISSAAPGARMALIPAVGAATSLSAALSTAARHPAHPVYPAGVGLFIGPEGGFTDAELRAADEAGIQAISLGPRTLRAETAAVAALTMLLFGLGEME